MRGTVRDSTTFERAKAEIDVQVERVSSTTGYLDISVGYVDTTTVHHLLASIDEHKTLVSQYVSAVLYGDLT